MGSSFYLPNKIFRRRKMPKEAKENVTKINVENEKNKRKSYNLSVYLYFV